MRTTKADLEWAFSELVAQLQTVERQRNDLARWKEEAIHVWPPMQEIAQELGLTLGPEIHSQILPGIKSLKRRIDLLERSLILKQKALADMGEKVNQLTGEKLELASREAEKISDPLPPQNPPSPEPV